MMATEAASRSVAASTSSISSLVGRSQTASRPPRQLDLRRSHFRALSRTIGSKSPCSAQNAICDDALTLRCHSCCPSRLPFAAKQGRQTSCSRFRESDFGRRFGNLDGLRKNDGCEPLPAWTSVLHRKGRRGVLDPCNARNKWFGGDQETEEETLPGVSQESSWPILKRWDIPWDAKATSLGMVGWLFSFLLTGLVVAIVAGQIGLGKGQLLTLDEQAIYVLINQLAQTLAGLAVVNSTVTPYKPLSPDLFTVEWQSPFSLRKGWILWGGIGILCAGAAVTAVSYVTFSINGQASPRDDTDALVQLMPLIGASPLSTISLIGVTGVLAPVLEETIFRGFLMTSLTKWAPTPVAIILSAITFAAAHFTPGEFPQLLSLGIILGLSYAQTRNLLTPILIHSIWNSGVVVLLAFLRLQGYDIKEII